MNGSRLLVIMMALLVAAWVCFREFPGVFSHPRTAESPVVEADEPVDDLPVPEIPSTEFQNTSLDAAHYVGSESCAECHRNEAEAFFATRHHRSMTRRPATLLPSARIDHPASGYSYATSTTEAGEIEQDESIIGAGTLTASRRAQVDFTIGSGRFGYSFASVLDGFWIQSPLTWYTTRECWDLSPGYDTKSQFSFRRAISARCLYCHTGITEVQEENEFQFSVHEMAIGCERCHGPGSLHADLHLTGGSVDTGADSTIANPARMDRTRQEAVCQQCHLQGHVQVALRGAEFDSFRPGMQLTDVRQDYVTSQNGSMSVVGHVEQMHASLCYQQTTTLTCTTCHDPHIQRTGPELEQHYQSTCLSCHEQEHCREDAEVRNARNDSCVACHMPSAPTEVPHVAFTHHRIGIHNADDLRKTVAGHASANAETTLQSMLGDEDLPEPEKSRARGLAWLTLFLSRPDVDPEHALQESRTLLIKAWDQGARDAEVSAGLARIAAEIGYTEQLERWARETLLRESSPTDPRMTALSVLGEHLFRTGDYEAGVECFAELTRHRRDARHWFFRGMLEQNLGMTEDAIQSLRRSTEINPRNPGAYSMLAAIEESRDRSEQAERYRMLAEELTTAPRLPSTD